MALDDEQSIGFGHLKVGDNPHLYRPVISCILFGLTILLTQNCLQNIYVHCKIGMGAYSQGVFIWEGCLFGRGVYLEGFIFWQGCISWQKCFFSHLLYD